MSPPKVTLVGPLTWRGVSDVKELQLGLLSLAAVLAPRRIPVQIVDLNLLTDVAIEQQALSVILQTNPDIVGLGSICSSYPLTLRLAAELKRARPALTVILGGPQASVVDQSTMLAFPAIDFVVRGEAEHSFPELLQSLGAAASLTRVSGITYRHGARVVRNPNAPVIHDLDELPLPLYDFYDPVSQRSSLPLEAGRGCPFACRFCSTNDFFRRKFRLKSSARLVSEMSLLHARYGIREFQLTHDMFTVDRRRVAEFCEALLLRDVRFRWRCSARTDCVDPELLELMARAGCTGIFFGIETGSPRLQQLIDKNLDLVEARKILHAADRLGIATTASLITGYPQEQLDDLDDTVNFFGESIRLEGCEPQLHLLSPLAATPFATEFREQLVYDRITSDVSSDGDSLHPVDELLVLAHPDIFPNFYALPCPIDRGYLYQLRAFLLAMAARAEGLLLALHSECGGLRPVFDEWRVIYPGVTNFESWEFFQAVLAFIAARYLGSGRISVEVLWRFYAALAAEAQAVPTVPLGPFDATHIKVAANRRVVTLRGDVIGVLDALRKAAAPDPAALDRLCTLAIETQAGRRNRIFELPPLSASILKLCQLPIGIETLAARLGLSEERTRQAIQILHRQGLIEFAHPPVSGKPVVE